MEGVEFVEFKESSMVSQQHSPLILLFSLLLLLLSNTNGERITINSKNASQTVYFVQPFSTGNISFGGVSPFTQEQYGMKTKKTKKTKKKTNKTKKKNTIFLSFSFIFSSFFKPLTHSSLFFSLFLSLFSIYYSFKTQFLAFIIVLVG